MTPRKRSANMTAHTRCTKIWATTPGAACESSTYAMPVTRGRIGNAFYEADTSLQQNRNSYWIQLRAGAARPASKNDDSECPTWSTVSRTIRAPNSSLFGGPALPRRQTRLRVDRHWVRTTQACKSNFDAGRTPGPTGAGIATSKHATPTTADAQPALDDGMAQAWSLDNNYGRK